MASKYLQQPSSDERFEACSHERAALRNRTLGGNEEYEQVEAARRSLAAAVEDFVWPYRDADAFVERACRSYARRCGVGRLLVLGSEIPVGQPLHRRVWQSSGIGYDEGRAVYVESNPTLLAKTRAWIEDSPNIEVVNEDPSLAPSNPQVAGLLTEATVVVLSGLLQFLDFQGAQALLDDLACASRNAAPGQGKMYVVATHSLMPDSTKGAELAAQWREADSRGHAGFFRTAAEITALFQGYTLSAPVCPARLWYPLGPEIGEVSPARDLVAGIVASA